MTQPQQAEPIYEALAQVWQRSKPVVLARLETIEAATAKLAAGRDDNALVESARGEAHKLAGVLGSFGLARGSELAHDLEQHLVAPCDEGEAARLKRVAAQLRALVAPA